MATVAGFKQKHRKKHFKKQKLKLFRANESMISVFMWGVNHTIKELSYIRCPLMLMPDDFKAFSKVKIDNHLYNKETLPSHFKVKEYCPVVFRRLRERFGVEDKDYTNSLCLQQPVRVEDTGRSRARFLQSVDRKFVIKTLSSEDIAEMHAILPTYHQYVVEQGAQTLLPQYLGMYRLTLNNAEHYMIVMRNVFSNGLKAHKKYDLKGSTVQREASEKEKTKEFPTFKDNDFVKDNVKIYMDHDARQDFLQKLKRDVEFLASLKLMDYSLLVGIHDREREDRYNDMLEVPDTDGYNGQADDGYSPVEDENNGVLATPPDSPGVTLRQDSNEEEISTNVYIFAGAENSPKNEIYFMGLIDILTHYDAKKKAAHAVKTAKHGFGADFSVKSPRVYAHRLLQFLERHTGVPVAPAKPPPPSEPNQPFVRQVVVYSDSETGTPVDSLLNPSAGGADDPGLAMDVSSATLTRFCYSNEELRTRGAESRTGIDRKAGAEISTVKPFQYSKRFMEFICEHVISPEAAAQPSQT